MGEKPAHIVLQMPADNKAGEQPVRFGTPAAILGTMSRSGDSNMQPATGVLKADLFGTVALRQDRHGTLFIRRDTREARWWTQPAARWLAAREARALAALDGIDGVPELLNFDGRVLDRTFLAGQPMHRARPTDAAYFRAALTLLRRIHSAGIAHNDLAKEPNWLVTQDGAPAILDFQLASHAPNRGAWFRLLGREDLRHFLKHKRTYRADYLTARERSALARRAWPARVWMAAVKPVYLWVTRRLLGWSDREGAGDRNLR